MNYRIGAKRSKVKENRKALNVVHIDLHGAFVSMLSMASRGESKIRR
jgi:hypothetical protein